jgi:hypothetical protein
MGDLEPLLEGAREGAINSSRFAMFTSADAGSYLNQSYQTVGFEPN